MILLLIVAVMAYTFRRWARGYATPWAEVAVPALGIAAAITDGRTITRLEEVCVVWWTVALLIALDGLAAHLGRGD